MVYLVNRIGEDRMADNDLDVLIMTDNNLDSVGGEQESTKIIINGIKDKYSIAIIQPGNISNPVSNVVYYELTKFTRIKHLVKRPISFIRYILKAKNIINSRKPKIIHTQAQVSFLIVALLKKLRVINKVFLIHTERGLYTKYNKFFKWLFCFFMDETNILVTTTEFNMKYWKMALKTKGVQLEYRVIENTAGKLFEEYDELLKKRDDKTLAIGFAGRYADWKNWPLAVEISEKLNFILGNKLKVTMAVGSLDEKALEKTKKMFNLMKKKFGNRFDGKINISLEEMDKFYYDIDIFILTSKYNTESFGRTLVEAMSRKNVVLTTDAGGSVEVVNNHNNVCRTADEFIERIMVFYMDKKKMNDEKERNLKRVSNVYSLDNNITKHIKMYEDIYKNTNGR